MDEMQNPVSQPVGPTGEIQKYTNGKIHFLTPKGVVTRYKKAITKMLILCRRRQNLGYSAFLTFFLLFCIPAVAIAAMAGFLFAPERFVYHILLAALAVVLAATCCKPAIKSLRNLEKGMAIRHLPIHIYVDQIGRKETEVRADGSAIYYLVMKCGAKTAVSYSTYEVMIRNAE